MDLTLMKLWISLSHSREFENALEIGNVEVFIDVDENVQCYGEMTDAEIYEQVDDSIEESIVEVDSVEIDDFLDALSSYDALQMIEKLKTYFSQNKTRLPEYIRSYC